MPVFHGGRLHGAVVPENSRRHTVDQRRAQLVDAAIAVLVEEGIAAATTRRITDRAGVALGAFHYAFESKDALVEAVMARFSDTIEGVVAGAAEGPVEDLHSVASRVLDAYWTFVEGTRDLQLAQYELTVHALRDERLRGLVDAHYARMTAAVAAVLEQLPDVGPGPDTDELARHLVATMDGLVLQLVVQRDEPEARRRLALYLRALPTLVDAMRVTT
jgi:TetR/AcrR family transcriptional regulator, regulator of biofilm formation and stress response